MKEEDKIELRGDDFQEVLGGIPPWILRWGITTIAIIVVILLIGSAIFKYPDKISSTVTLTGTMPTANIVAKTSGKIQKLYIDDNCFVKEGEYIAILENSARTVDILSLKTFLLRYMTSPDSIQKLPIKNLHLGSCQPLYASYYTTLSQYIQFRDLGYYLEKVHLMKERIQRNKVYYHDMIRQRSLVEKQMQVSYKQYKRDSILNKDGLISDEVLETTYNQYLQGQLSLENMYSTLENLQIQLTQMNENLLDTEYQYVDKKSSLEIQLKTLAAQLFTELQTWELNYALMAPISGKVTFTNYWKENQNVVSGNIVFSIVPSQNDILLGKALLPAKRSGKVKVGQKVNIRFSNFPDNEFGVVKGVVQNISLVSVKVEKISNYIVEIRLPDGLKTTYNKVLPFVPEMEGQADIITDDLSLLERLLLPIKKILKENL